MLKRQASNIINHYLPVLLFLLCLVFKFIFIDKRDISIDEPFSIFHAQQDLKHIFYLSTEGEPNTPLFLILLHVWIKLFGYGTTALRLLPLILNSLTAVVIYKTGKRFFNVPTSIAASLFFIFSFGHFFHGLEVRSYSMFTLAVSLSLFSFLDVIKTPGNKSIIRLVLSNLFVIYSHYFGWFIILSEGIGLLIFLNDRKIVYRLFLSIGLTIVGFIPLIKIMINQFFRSSKGTWLNAPITGDFKKELLFLFNDDSIFLAFKIIVILGIILLILRFLKYGVWKPEVDRKYIILLLWSIIPFTLMYYISFRMPIFTGRYILYTAPGFFLLVAYTVSVLLSNHKIPQIISLVLIVFLMAVHLKILPKDFGWRDIKHTAEFIKNSEKDLDNRVIIVFPAWVNLELIYHYDLPLFRNYINFDAKCDKARIKKAWSVNQIKEYANKYKNNDLILLTNTGKEDTQEAFAVLDSTHIYVKRAEFPEFYVAGVFKANKE